MIARIKSVLVLLLMLAAFAGAQAWRPTSRLADTRPKIDLETLFPKSFSGWSLDDHMPVQLVSPDAQEVLDKIYSQTLSRTYVNARGDRVMLSVAYGGDQSDATRAHRPEVCYPAQGFEITARRDGLVNLGTYNLRVRQLESRLGARVEPISYWITVGDHVTLSGTEQKLAQLAYSTRGFIPDGMLVRVSSIETDAGVAYRQQQDFLAEMVKAVRRDLQPLVVGRHAE